MDQDEVDTDADSDFQLNDAFETHEVESLEELSIRNQRLARIQELEEEAIARRDPYAAVIGMGNASLQRVFEHLGAAILDTLDSAPDTLEIFGKVAPEIRLLVKLRNSIETDLRFQLHDSEQLSTELHREKRGLGIDRQMLMRKHEMGPKTWRANGGR